MSHDEIPVFTRWYKFLIWVLDSTEKFPKKVRFTLSSRIDNITLDVLEKIIEAAYTHSKIDILRSANLKVEKLRVLLRICYEKGYLNNRSYEYAVKELYETGRMLGGWIKNQEKK
jgi:four helix bundle protein